MTEETRKKVFDPFFTTKDVHKGTGIGLSLTYNFIKELGGNIKVESTPNEGSKFQIRFPVQKKEYKVKGVQAVTVNVNPDLAKSLKEKRVLLVDDEAGIRSLLSMMLEEYGMKVVTAPNGEQALALYEKEENSFDLIISDIKMPGMTGPELLKKVKSSPHASDGPKFIFITGGVNMNLGQDEEVSELIDGYFYKPFEEKEVLNAIENALFIKKTIKSA